MKIMVVGGGGREHAIIKKLKENPKVETIYALPGNGGIAADAICVVYSCNRYFAPSHTSLVTPMPIPYATACICKISSNVLRMPRTPAPSNARTIISGFFKT